MSERIKLAELRARYGKEPNDVWGEAYDPDVLALVEAVEAAHRANFDVPCDACELLDRDCPNERLRAALLKFDFGDRDA